MIRYALHCDDGHGFESWFRDSDAYDSQAKVGLLACPVCGSGKIAKQIMSPAVSVHDEVVPARRSMTMMGGKDREIRAMLRAFRQHLEANAENVGAGFADEARKIHHGEADARAIYGETSLDEAKALTEEGIEVMPVPDLPDDLN